MKIHATFVNFTYDADSVELIHAWDEYSVDNNPSGYEDTKREALATYGTELLRSVTVEIRIDDHPVIQALNPHLTIDGEVRT